LYLLSSLTFFSFSTREKSGLYKSKSSGTLYSIVSLSVSHSPLLGDSPPFSSYSHLDSVFEISYYNTLLFS